MSTTNDDRRSERAEIELLLPWYVAGTLDADDRQRVADYLERDDELRAQLALIEEDRSETQIANERLGMPSAGALARLMDRITDETPAKASAGGKAVGFWRKIDAFIEDLQPSAVRWAAVAAAVMIFVQAIALGGLLKTVEGGKGYQTASGESAAKRQGTFALVNFSVSANAQQISELLAASGAQIVEGPKPGGMYRIKISATKLADAERDRAIEALARDTNIISLALPAE
ncbi:MAG: hypothetical protein ACR2OX_06415 [Methyloligellaceae bacterium]